MSNDIVPQEWEERAFENAEFGVLRVYVNRRTGEVQFNLDDVARILGMSAEEVKEAAGKENVTGSTERETLTWTTERVAAELHMHPVSVARLARQGRLPGRKVGRAWLYPAAEIKKLCGVE